MKLNRKGFMMAEVVVVSAIVLIFLAGLFTSYNQIYSKYKSRIRYYDSVTLYQLAYYRDSLIDNHQMVSTLADAKNNKIVSLSNDNKAFVIYGLNGDEFNDRSDINLTYKEYIKYLKNAANLTSNYVMVLERCNNGDDCKYAYLEVYDASDYTNSGG